MTSRTRSCETASEFDPQNWWTKWGAILGVAQSPKIQSIKGDKRNGLSHLVPLLEFNQYWIVDVAAKVVRIHRLNQAKTYAEETHSKDRIALQAFPDVTIELGNLF